MINLKRKGKLLSLMGVVLSGILMMSASQAVPIYFSNLTNNSALDLSGQLYGDVEQTGTSASLTFYNDVDSGIYSSITDIYFDYDSGVVTSGWTINESAGVEYSEYAAPGNLPGGQSIGFDADYSADSDSPAITANGVNATGESVTFLATLADGFDLLSAIYEGAFRIGLHIQAIEDGYDNSDSYTSVVPLPAAAWLFGSALIGFMVTSRRRKNG